MERKEDFPLKFKSKFYRKKDEKIILVSSKHKISSPPILLKNEFQHLEKSQHHEEMTTYRQQSSQPPFLPLVQHSISQHHSFQQNSQTLQHQPLSVQQNKPFQQPTSLSLQKRISKSYENIDNSSAVIINAYHSSDNLNNSTDTINNSNNKSFSFASHDDFVNNNINNNDNHYLDLKTHVFKNKVFSFSTQTINKASQSPLFHIRKHFCKFTNSNHNNRNNNNSNENSNNNNNINNNNNNNTTNDVIKKHKKRNISLDWANFLNRKKTNQITLLSYRAQQIEKIYTNNNKVNIINYNQLNTNNNNNNKNRVVFSQNLNKDNPNKTNINNNTRTSNNNSCSNPSNNKNKIILTSNNITETNLMHEALKNELLKISSAPQSSLSSLPDHPSTKKYRRLNMDEYEEEEDDVFDAYVIKKDGHVVKDGGGLKGSEDVGEKDVNNNDNISTSTINISQNISTNNNTHLNTTNNLLSNSFDNIQNNDDDDNEDGGADDDVRRFNSFPSARSHQSLPAKIAPPSLNKQRKRFLGPIVPVEVLLSWSRGGLRKPLMTSCRGEADEMLMGIQRYMGDVRVVGPFVLRRMKKGGMWLGGGGEKDGGLGRGGGVGKDDGANGAWKDGILCEVVRKGWSDVSWRDEIYMQLCKQTHNNPSVNSTHLGWEMVCVCLCFFPPSHSSPFLSYRIKLATSLLRHAPHPKLQKCLEKLPLRMTSSLKEGVRRGVKQPLMQEVLVAKNSIYSAGLFGSDLKDLMTLQRPLIPGSRVPWIMTSLVDCVRRLGGLRVEGIFRVPGDIDEVNKSRTELSQMWHQATNSHAPLRMPPSMTSDPSVVASLLKLWMRQLPQPIIPAESYHRVLNCHPSDLPLVLKACLPPINLQVLFYLVSFLKEMCSDEVVSHTKMDANNLAMVMAPNLFRMECTGASLILESAKKEMTFVRSLLLSSAFDDV